ncbi:MAG TPA: DNA topoisomerase VI subunit B [Planctomycetota bacterium]
MAVSKSMTAEEMGKQQKEISVSEFFAKNRHLLGFDNPRKALLTTIKEAVDNSLDACEEAGIAPEILIEVQQIAEDRFRVAVQDNGPGIVKEQIPRIFGQLLYGSKFHRLRQSRGQQGIGISAAGMYGQMTTGMGPRVISKVKRRKAHRYEIHLDLTKNRPIVGKDEEVEDWGPSHGTRVEIDLEATYQRGLRSVDDYLKQTAVANPHCRIEYRSPDAEARIYEPATKELPPKALEIKPHPYGVELGQLIKMLRDTNSRWLSGFLQEEFCRVGPKVAKDIIQEAKLGERSYPTRIARDEADQLYRAIQKTKISAPPTDCLAPIREEQILAGLQKEADAEFYAVATRAPSVYRGNPFQIEVGIAWGKPGGAELEVDERGRIHSTKKKKRGTADTEDLLGNADEPVRLLRFANRVPLLYQQSACAVTKAVMQTTWKNYGLQQSRGALPVGPAVLLVHIASVWVPFTSESKEAIAAYPEIVKEVKLCLQEAGRKLGAFIRKGRRVSREFEKRGYIDKYLPHIGIGLQEILGLSDEKRDEAVERLRDSMETSRSI